MSVLKVMAMLITSLIYERSAMADIPVIDITSIVQGTISAEEAVDQTAKQIEQYRLQLQELEIMARSENVADVDWANAQNTITSLVKAVDTLKYYKQQVGNISQNINQFRDIDFYKNSQCFAAAGCSDAEREEILKNRTLASTTQKKANDALLESITVQQTSLSRDADQLNRLQDSAQGAAGQLAALAYANQFAAQQANQLLQIRELLTTQQNALAIQSQAQIDRQAQQDASSQQMRASARYKPSPQRTNW